MNRSGGRAVAFGVVAVLLILAAMALSVSLLPPAPIAPTPTWPLGIDLPDKLPRIPR